MDNSDFSLFMDLHNHTIWSDGADKADEIIKNAISHKVEVVGITDHFCNDGRYSLGFENVKVYLNKIDWLKNKYNNEIKVLIGVEIAYSYLLRNCKVLPYDTLNRLDYILLEDLDYIPQTTDLKDVSSLLIGFNCSKGLAHTDLVRLAEKFSNRGGLAYVLDFVKESELFWEINTESSHDIFFNILCSGKKDEKTEELMTGIVNRKIHVSVGSDTHALVQYDYGRLRLANDVAKLLNREGTV